MEQDICDSIFNIFDADRSGSIDIDEFGTYVMNADFMPNYSAKESRVLDFVESQFELGIIIQNHFTFNDIIFLKFKHL